MTRQQSKGHGFEIALDEAAGVEGRFVSWLACAARSWAGEECAPWQIGSEDLRAEAREDFGEEVGEESGEDFVSA